MQPDMLWTKSRGDNSDPIIRDSQRGIGNRLLVHATDGEGGATEQPLSILMDFL